MLIVTRRVGESIVINDQVSIKVLATTDGHSSRLGIDAPKDVTIYREEAKTRYRKTEAPER